MQINATQVTNELISYSIVTDKNSWVRLLERNGIQMPNNSAGRKYNSSSFALDVEFVVKENNRRTNLKQRVTLGYE